MKNDIIILTDYKNYFGSKVTSIPYRSGFDKLKLENYFQKFGYNIHFMKFADINKLEFDFRNKIVLYTSSEDKDLLYKQFISDVLYKLKMADAILIPEYQYFLAHDNKVFMELLGKKLGISNLKSFVFGCLEELKNNLEKIELPVVIKPSKGSMSRGVYLINSYAELIQKAKKISRSKSFHRDLKDFLRNFKYKGYKRDSKYRRKFIVQQFIPNLNYDWKVLVYGDKYYILNRENRNGDFRASGSGKFKFNEILPIGLLDFAFDTFRKLNVPTLSMDIATDGLKYYLFEYQVIYFGTYALEFSPFYFKKNENEWVVIHSKSILEEEYVNSIVQYLNKIKNENPFRIQR